MKPELINTAILAVSFLALFGFAELLYHVFKVEAELTRKLVHIGTGILTLLFPIMLDNHWLVLFLCASFLVILTLSLKFDLLKSINAIDRKSQGSILYPIVVYVIYLIYTQFDNYVFFYLPILTMAICDPIAALVGKRWPIGGYKVGKDNKTMAGSTAFAVAGLVLAMVLLLNMTDLSVGNALLVGLSVAVVAAFVEGISQNGFDNLLIPFSVMGVMVGFQGLIL